MKLLEDVNKMRTKFDFKALKAKLDTLNRDKGEV